MTGVSDASLISELQFAAALTKEEEFVLRLGIRSADEEHVLARELVKAGASVFQLLRRRDLVVSYK